jgi:hypothetical protein
MSRRAAWRSTGAGDQQVVDGRGQRVEEPLEPVEVGGVEGGDAGPEFEAGAVQAVRVAGGEDDACSLGAGELGRLEPDAGAAPDHHDGLPEQVLLALHGRTVDRDGHGSSGRRRRSRRQFRPGRSAVMCAADQPGQFASRWLGQESPLRFDGCVAPGRHPGAAPGSAGFRGPGRGCTLC